MASPVQVARWVISAGWTGLDRVTATAVGISTGADPAAPGGVWGVNGATGDGAAQAVAARQAVATQGWDVLPAHRSGRYVLYLPAAQAALTVALADMAAEKIPNPVEAAGDAARGATDAVKSVADTLTAPIRQLLYLGTPEAQSRIAKFLIGSALIIVGGFVFATGAATRATRAGIGVLDDSVAKLVVIRSNLTAGGGAAPSRPASTPGAARPGPPPRRRRDDTPTVRVNPNVARARGVLGAQEARAKGIAPTKATAKAPPRPLPGSSDSPMKRRRTG